MLAIGTLGRLGCPEVVPVLRRVLDGGTEYEYFETVTAGDVLASRSKITRFDERVGSIGPMIITYHETAYRRQDGVLVAKMYGHLIHY